MLRYFYAMDFRYQPDEKKFKQMNQVYLEPQIKNESPYNFPNMNVYLNSKETAELTYLNKHSNQAQTSIQKRSDPLNQSVRSLVQTWASVTVQIFVELVKWFSNIPSVYGKYFDENDSTNEWYVGLQRMLVDLTRLLTKEGRSIYVGATLVMLSLMLILLFMDN